MTERTLRPYQQTAVDSVFDYFGRRQGNPLVVLPTGAGKSIVAADFIRRALEQYPTTRIVCVTHVKELIAQNAAALARWAPDLALKIGVYSAGLNRREPGAQVLFAGIQSVHKKTRTIGHADLLLVDEAHLIPHKGAGMYRRFVEDMKDINPVMKVIGFTATPYRMGQGLLTQGADAIFSSVCCNADIVELIDDGYLCELVTQRGDAQYDTSGLRRRGGDFVQSQLQKRIDESEDVTEQAVREMCEEGAHCKSWLVFCTTVAQAEAVVRMLDVPAQLITGDTPAATRDGIIGAFKAGQIRAIVNVNVLTTGFDAPNVDMIALLRPTESVGLYVQILGRGMRMHPEKDRCLVLDFGGNIDRHGPINRVKMPRPPRAREGEAVVKMCPECLFEGIPAGMMVCPECGFEFPQREVKLTQRSRKEVIARSTRKWVPVSRVVYSRHRKEGKPDSLRVEYWGGLNKIATEWVCVEHDGYAGEKALGWFMRRIDVDGFPPGTVQSAINMGKAGELREPAAILVDTSKRWVEIASYSFDGIPGAPAQGEA